MKTFTNDITQEVDVIEFELKSGLIDNKTAFERVANLCETYSKDYGEFVQRKIDEVEAKGRDRESLPIFVKDTQSLSRLANILLSEELSDRSANKVAATEYPFLSDAQLRRRTYGLHERKSLGGFKEVGLSRFFALGSDKKDYRYPHRTFLPIKTQIDNAMKGGVSGDVRSFYLGDEE